MATNTTTGAPTPTQNDLTASCTTAVPGKYGNVPIDACNSYYNFDPKFAPAVAVAVLFGILSTTHIVEAIVFKKRYAWVLIMGALWETIGFAMHAAGAHNQQNVGYATAHNLLFLLAPLWINAFAYMTFARMVHFFLPDQRVGAIKGQSLAKYFVLADIVAFIIQGVGGIMASPGASPDTIKIGINVYMGGIGLQEAFIIFFVTLMVTFHRECVGLERSGTAIRERPWRPLLFALYGVLTCISVRIIYRICEYAKGIQPSNPVPFHEAYAYALDAFPMMVAILIMAIWHPGRTLVGPDADFPKKPSRKERKAAKKAKKEEKRRAKEEKKAGKREGRGKQLRESVSPVRDESRSYEERGYDDHGREERRYEQYSMDQRSRV